MEVAVFHTQEKRRSLPKNEPQVFKKGQLAQQWLRGCSSATIFLIKHFFKRAFATFL